MRDVVIESQLGRYANILEQWMVEPLLVEQQQDAHGAGLDMRDPFARLGETNLEMLADHVFYDRAGALVGDEANLHAGGLVQQLLVAVMDGADLVAAHAQFVGVRLGVGDQVFIGLERAVRVHRDRVDMLFHTRDQSELVIAIGEMRQVEITGETAAHMHQGLAVGRLALDVDRRLVVRAAALERHVYRHAQKIGQFEMFGDKLAPLRRAGTRRGRAYQLNRSVRERRLRRAGKAQRHSGERRRDQRET